MERGFSDFGRWLWAGIHVSCSTPDKRKMDSRFCGNDGPNRRPREQLERNFRSKRWWRGFPRFNEVAIALSEAASARTRWIPACAGMTKTAASHAYSRSGNRCWKSLMEATHFLNVFPTFARSLR